MKPLLLLSLALFVSCTPTPNPNEPRTFYSHLPRSVSPSGFSGDPNLMLAVVVEGEVVHPGPYSVPAGLTLSDVLHKAGGFAKFASQRGIQIVRGGQTLHIDFRRVRKKKAQDPILEKGDIIRVPRETSMH